MTAGKTLSAERIIGARHLQMQKVEYRKNLIFSFVAPALFSILCLLASFAYSLFSPSDAFAQTNEPSTLNSQPTAANYQLLSTNFLLPLTTRLWRLIISVMRSPVF